MNSRNHVIKGICGFVVGHMAPNHKLLTWLHEAMWPNVVAVHLVEVEIWPILIFNVRRRTHMIILLQSVIIQIRRLFWHTSCYKVRQSNFMRKCDRLLLQSTSGIAKCDRLLLQIRQVLQSATVIAKWNVTLVLQINSLKVLLILKQNF